MYEQLLPGETRLIECRQHKIMFFEPMMWLMLATVPVWFIALNDLSPWLWIIPGVLYLWGWILFFMRMIEYYSTKFIVTSERIILKSGILTREAMELMIDKCEGVMVSQSIFGRIFNYGTITVTTGEVSNLYKMVSDPLSFRDAISSARIDD